MKVLHFILGKAAKERANGVNQVVAGLAKYTAKLGVEVQVIGKTPSVSGEGAVVRRDGYDVHTYTSRGIKAGVQEAIRWADIVHLHGGYSLWNAYVAMQCVRAAKPYVVTLHNSLSPQLAGLKSSTKKLLFHKIVQRRQLAKAAAIHALTEEECTDILADFTPRRLVCIPNGVDIDDFPLSQPPSEPSSRVRIGYLGRLSKEKNLEALCQAFIKVNQGGSLGLVLAGPESGYGIDLQSRYAHAGIEIRGPAYGQAKLGFLSELDLIVLPSLSEGFSILAAEALALGRPLLITRTCKLSYYLDRGCFFMCEPTSFGLERGLRLALSERSKWRQMGERARVLVEDRLSWHNIAKDMVATYETVVGAGH